eukprot:scaffold28701_cov56-Attheya_sp.AAC.2
MLLPCEKSSVVWGVVSQGQQWTKKPWCAALSRVICALSPTDHATVSPGTWGNSSLIVMGLKLLRY